MRQFLAKLAIKYLYDDITSIIEQESFEEVEKLAKEEGKTLQEWYFDKERDTDDAWERYISTN